MKSERMNDFRATLETAGTQDHRVFWQLRLSHSEVCVLGSWFTRTWDWSSPGRSLAQHSIVCTLGTLNTCTHREYVIIQMQVGMCSLDHLYQYRTLNFILVCKLCAGIFIVSPFRK